MESGKRIFEIIFDDENNPIDIIFEGKAERSSLEDKILNLIIQKQKEGLEFRTNKCCIYCEIDEKHEYGFKVNFIAYNYSKSNESK